MIGLKRPMIRANPPMGLFVLVIVLLHHLAQESDRLFASATSTLIRHIYFASRYEPTKTLDVALEAACANCSVNVPPAFTTIYISIVMP